MGQGLFGLARSQPGHGGGALVVGGVRNSGANRANRNLSNQLCFAGSSFGTEGDGSPFVGYQPVFTEKGNLS
jgi:hypothetical protein